MKERTCDSIISKMKQRYKTNGTRSFIYVETSIKQPIASRGTHTHTHTHTHTQKKKNSKLSNRLLQRNGCQTRKDSNNTASQSQDQTPTQNDCTIKYDVEQATQRSSR